MGRWGVRRRRISRWVLGWLRGWEGVLKGHVDEVLLRSLIRLWLSTYLPLVEMVDSGEEGSS